MKTIALRSRFSSATEIAASLAEFKMDVVTFMDVNDLERLFEKGSPIEVVFDVNYHRDVHEACRERQVPQIVWSFDSGVAEIIDFRGMRDDDFLFLYDRGDYLACRKGGANCRYLPFSAGRRFELPPRRDDFENEVLLVMNTYREAEIENDREFKDMLERSDDRLEVEGLRLMKAIMDAVVRDHLGVLDQDGLQEAAEAMLERSGAGGFFRHDVLDRKLRRHYGQILSSRQRGALALALDSAGLASTIYGDDAWLDILAGARFASFRGRAAYDALPHLYNSAKINVNLTQIQNLSGVPQRVFHVLAAGGFLLTNSSPELERLFTPGEHLDTFGSMWELLDKVHHYRSNEAERKRIAESGHREFLASHRMNARVSEILKTIN